VIKLIILHFFRNINTLNHFRDVFSDLAGWKLHKFIELVGHCLTAAPTFFEIMEDRISRVVLTFLVCLCFRIIFFCAAFVDATVFSVFC
jgi:hypothetical protein